MGAHYKVMYDMLLVVYAEVDTVTLTELSSFNFYLSIQCHDTDSYNFMLYTGWLKIKYPTRQYAISLQPVVIF